MSRDTDEPQGGRLLQAVLWDMDGTLVDTEPVWIAAEYELAERHGSTWSHDHALNLVGRDLLDSGRYIQQHMRLSMSPELVVEALLDHVVHVVRQGVEWCAGARDLLAAQQRAGVPAALVTMSYRRLADAVTDGLPSATFGATIVGDEVDSGKPHPEPYLAAARALGVDPGLCIAIEDSETGATSAEAAGCHVLAVPKHVPVPAGPHRTLATTLEGLGVDDLEAMLAQARTCVR